MNFVHNIKFKEKNNPWLLIAQQKNENLDNKEVKKIQGSYCKIYNGLLLFFLP